MPRKPTSPKRAIRKRQSVADAIFLILLAGTASASAGLPFYVHFHPDQFGPPKMQFSGDLERNLADQIGSNEYERRLATLVKPRLQLDQATTGSIGIVKRPPIRNVTQPFPEERLVPSPTPELMFATDDRALIVDGGKVELVKIGSRLSDGSAIKSIKKNKDGWEVATTGGATLRWEGLK